MHRDLKLENIMVHFPNLPKTQTEINKYVKNLFSFLNIRSIVVKFFFTFGCRIQIFWYPYHASLIQYYLVRSTPPWAWNPRRFINFIKCHAYPGHCWVLYAGAYPSIQFILRVSIIDTKCQPTPVSKWDSDFTLICDTIKKSLCWPTFLVRLSL